MKKVIILAILAVAVMCSGCATQNSSGMVVTHHPGLIETAAILPVAVLSGATRALVGYNTVETPEAYTERIRAQSTPVIYQQPTTYVYGTPYYTGFPIMFPDAYYWGWVSNRPGIIYVMHRGGNRSFHYAPAGYRRR
jgi:hypothetical protein